MGRDKHTCSKVHAEELANAHEDEGASAPFLKLYCMERNGFTLIELLITLVVFSVIVLIALPMCGIQGKKSEQVHAKAQLMTIKESQDKYKMEHGAYTTDTTKLTNWKMGTKKYRFQVDYIDRSRFTAQAHGDTDNDKVYDDVIWAIDQSGTLIQIK